MIRISSVLFAACLLVSAQQGTGLDDQMLEKGDKLLEEAKTSYEEARSKSSVAAFVEAGFRLEEARIKFIVLQEIGSPEKQKVAADRMRAINQLGKLIHDGKVAIAGSPVEPGISAKPADSPASSAKPDAPKADPEPSKPAMDVSKRMAVPDASKQREAEKQIKDLFKEQYAKKSPTDRQALVRTLLDQATKTADDPAALWVLYRDAQDISVQLGDVRSAIRAIDAAAGQFDVDGITLKQSALTTLGKSAKAPSECADLSVALLELVDLLIAADQYESADKMTALALQAARKSGDQGLVARGTTRSKVVAEAKSRYLAMKGILQTLAKTPEDPAANNEMGQFLCFVKGSWDLGLRFLSKGSDPALKALADKELAAPGTGSEQVAVADGWWDLAEKEKSPLRKAQMVSHALVLYELALPSTTGIVRAKLEKRLGEVDHAPPSGAGAVDLLKVIDPKKDAVSGQWKMEDGALTCSSGEGTKLQIMYQPPEEYDVTMVVARRTGRDNVTIGLVSGGTQFNVSIDCLGGSASAIETIDGASVLGSNPSKVQGSFLTGNQPHTVVYSVRKKGVLVSVDGKKIISWEGESSHLGTQGGWKIPDARALSIGSWSGEIAITRLFLTPISGQGKKLR